MNYPIRHLSAGFGFLYQTTLTTCYLPLAVYCLLVVKKLQTSPTVTSAARTAGPWRAGAAPWCPSDPCIHARRRLPESCCWIPFGDRTRAVLAQQQAPGAELPMGGETHHRKI